MRTEKEIRYRLERLKECLAILEAPVLRDATLRTRIEMSAVIEELEVILDDPIPENPDEGP